MRKSIYPILLLLVVSALGAQNVHLETAGSIIIGNSSDPNPKPGTMRWTGADFEAYNGDKWVSMTGGKTAPAIDPDGNVYPTLRIGDQIWFLESLRTSKYADGTAIPLVTDQTQWGSLSTGAYTWYDNNNIYDNPEGKLYNWFAVADSSKLCPDGWRVPSLDDYNELIDYLGDAAVAGGKMKQEGTSTWNSPNNGATNSSGFTALGYGTRYSDGTFASLFFRSVSYFWTSSPGTINKAWQVGVFNQHTSVITSSISDKSGVPVRCVK